MRHRWHTKIGGIERFLYVGWIESSDPNSVKLLGFAYALHNGRYYYKVLTYVMKCTRNIEN